MNETILSATKQARLEALQECLKISRQEEKSELRASEKAEASGRVNVASHRKAGEEVAVRITDAIKALIDKEKGE